MQLMWKVLNVVLLDERQRQRQYSLLEQAYA